MRPAHTAHSPETWGTARAAHMRLQTACRHTHPTVPPPAGRRRVTAHKSSERMPRTRITSRPELEQPTGGLPQSAAQHSHMMQTRMSTNPPAVTSPTRGGLPRRAAHITHYAHAYANTTHALLSAAREKGCHKAQPGGPHHATASADNPLPPPQHPPMAHTRRTRAHSMPPINNTLGAAYAQHADVYANARTAQEPPRAPTNTPDRSGRIRLQPTAAHPIPPHSHLMRK